MKDMQYDIPQLVENQKLFFATGKTKEYQFRRNALQQLRNAIEQNEQSLCDALWADLHKSENESFLTEISIVYDEINYALKNLRKMMRRTRVANDIKTAPSKGYIIYEPLGTALIISPWNYPVNLLLCPLVGAIAAGCTAVLKSSPDTPNVNRVINHIITTAFPAEYITYTEGNRDVNRTLLAERYDIIFFTGSPALGRVVMEAAAKNLTPCILELGGKSPCVVDADADIKVAARRIMWGKTINAGQTCIAPDYLFVHKSVKERLFAEMEQYITDTFGTNPQECPLFGRIISDKAMKRLIPLLNTSGKTVFGGNYDISSRYIAPTVIDNVSESDAIMQEEIFGPILPSMTFDNIDTVVNYINRHEKPLAAYYFGSEENGTRFISRTSSGGACINDTIMHISNANLPFGGVGNSGMGKYHHHESFLAFSNRRSLLVSPKWFDLIVKYPPYRGLKIIKRFLK